MKRELFTRLVCALIVCLPSAQAVAAQEAPAPAPERFVLQVVYLAGRKPAYSAVPDGGWYGMFGTVTTPEPRAAADTVRAVAVRTRLEGGRVQIKVGVHVGERFFDRLEEVATYAVGPGETVEARELERVGVAPFVFKVLRVNGADTAGPAVINHTQSIAASVAEFTPSPLPRAKIRLHNLSSKRVRSVELRTIFDGRPRTLSTASEREGKVLMEPGGTYDRKVGVTDGRATDTDFTPETIEGVVVASVVFEDYTHEGDVEGAARRMAWDEGERAQLPRVLSLVRGAHARPDVESAEAVRRFRSGLTALDRAAPQTSVDKILKTYPALPAARRGDVQETVEVAMHQVRVDLLEDLNKFEKQFRGAPAGHSFKRWLKERQARYEGWLARL